MKKENGLLAFLIAYYTFASPIADAAALRYEVKAKCFIPMCHHHHCCLSVLRNILSSQTPKSKLKGYNKSCAAWRWVASEINTSITPASAPVRPFPESYQYTVRESLPVQSVVARFKAADADIGSNAEMDYRIMDGDGPGMFNITTDEDTQEGVIILLKVQHEQQTP